MDSIGKIKKLTAAEIRQRVWKHEEKDMTPWVCENIGFLNEALGLEIEVQSSEEQVENFKLDIYGTDSSSTKEPLPVVIENQFGKSDHDHLGKVITYAANKEAGVVIWIANDIQSAHRNAVDWLNAVTPEDMMFYGVELEMYTIN